MSDGKRSPRILAVRWGRMGVEGIGAGKDFKLYPGGGREWDWNETGTRHSPGIQPADVEELLAQAEVPGMCHSSGVLYAACSGPA
jgi:hypothetical protein